MLEYTIKASYGNDSVALIQWCYERDLQNVVVLYNDTGWAQSERGKFDLDDGNESPGCEAGWCGL